MFLLINSTDETYQNIPHTRVRIQNCLENSTPVRFEIKTRIRCFSRTRQAFEKIQRLILT